MHQAPHSRRIYVSALLIALLLSIAGAERATAQNNLAAGVPGAGAQVHALKVTLLSTTPTPLQVDVTSRLRSKPPQ